MDFGKIHDRDKLERVAFEPPSLQLPQDETVLDNETGSFEAFPVCNLWSNTKWKGVIYPEKAKPDSFLGHYGKQFRGIEMNATFYRNFAKSTIEKWTKQVPAEFLFFAKFNRDLSHTYRLRPPRHVFDDFFESMSYFGEKLGTLFLQLPPDFKADERTVFDHFIEQLPEGFSYAVEWRHPSWWADSPEAEATFARLEKRNIALICTDVAGRRDLLHARLTADTFFLRFVGNDLHQTDFERVEQWLPIFQKMKKRGLRQLIWVVHQPNDELNAPRLVAHINRRLEEEGLAEQLPEIKLRDTTEQQQLF